MTMVLPSDWDVQSPAERTDPVSELPANLKILHVLDHSVPLHSGYSFRTLAILRAQRARGWRTAHLTTPKHTLEGPLEETIDDLVFHRTPALGPATRLPVLHEIALINAVAQRIEAVARVERPHVIHAHSPVLNALAAFKAARRLRLPVVYEVRAFWEDAAVDLGTTKEGSLRYRLTRALETYALRRADAITTICDGLRKDMIARGLPAEKIAVIPNAVDIEHFEFGRVADVALKRRLGLEGRAVLGFIGSFYAYEGLDLLVRAMPQILAQRPDVALLLVGGGPTEDAIRTLVDQLGIGGAVRFVGRVPHSEVPNYYDLVDLFIYARHSMRLTELVTPLKPLEAMAQGRLVLVSDVGGHRELVRAGETGFFFRAGDPNALAQAAVSILASPEDWPRVRTSARRFVEGERNWTRSIAPQAKVYGQALKAKIG
jgi:PEP-CTERM/exosortase A-associated glycosyltransferase